MLEHRLLEARKKKGLTQKQVAEKAGIHVASYSAYENNHKTPPADVLSNIADVLDVSLDWLMGRSEEPGHLLTLGDIARSIYRIEKAMNAWIPYSCNIYAVGEDTKGGIPPCLYRTWK